jgi:dephospho-CoA kinase
MPSGHPRAPATGGKRPLRIGLTGGIASGKTTVADILAGLGAQIIDTDAIAREIVVPGSPALEAIVAAFGEEVLAADGGLDRARMRARVFADDTERLRLEAILHPLIRAEMLRRAATVLAPVQVFVIPLLVEGGLGTLVDRVLVVDCPEAVQLERLMQRDGTPEAQARRMLAAQASRAQRLAAADDVIDNSADLPALEDRARALFTRYLALAGP